MRSREACRGEACCSVIQEREWGEAVQAADEEEGEAGLCGPELQGPGRWGPGYTTFWEGALQGQLGSGLLIIFLAPS